MTTFDSGISRAKVIPIIPLPHPTSNILGLFSLRSRASFTTCSVSTLGIKTRLSTKKNLPKNSIPLVK
jgi:hypothetical protein